MMAVDLDIRKITFTNKKTNFTRTFLLPDDFKLKPVYVFVTMD